MKKIVSVLLAVLIVAAFVGFALGSSSAEEVANQGTGETAKKDSAQSEIADCSVEIQSCRLAQDWEGKPVVIVKYSFTNNKDEAQSFMLAFEHEVYQNGVGLNESWMVADSAGYSSDNQTKKIQKGATLEVEVAYELNDTTTDISVEVSGLFTFDDSKVTKTFPIV